jgi:hypothetical protein
MEDYLLKMAASVPPPPSSSYSVTLILTVGRWGLCPFSGVTLKSPWPTEQGEVRLYGFQGQATEGKMASAWHVHILTHSLSLCFPPSLSFSLFTLRIQLSGHKERVMWKRTEDPSRQPVLAVGLESK